MSTYGTRSCYVHGCREPECRLANASYERDRAFVARQRTVRPTLREMSDVETAWLAGLLEGEASFILQDVPATSRQAARIRIKVALDMTDRDVVERVSQIVGLGKVIARPRRKPHHKDTYFWQISSMANVVKLFLRLRPHMGQRRRDQIDKCLSAAEVFGVRDRRRRPVHADVV